MPSSIRPAPAAALRSLVPILLVAFLGLAGPAAAQSTDQSDGQDAYGATQPTAEFVVNEIMNQFEMSAGKVVSLARAMPAEAYEWQPMEGVASVARAYMHIAAYNYLYPEMALDVPAPDGLEYRTWEEQVTGKEQVVELLEGSMDHVRSVVGGMSGEDLAEATELYGREVPRWAVLLQLVTHMNEHLGQQIAYARSNEIVPPWSR